MKHLFVLALILLVSVSAFAASTSETYPQTYDRQMTQRIVTTAAHSDADVVMYVREPGLTALSFSLEYNDSVNVTNVIVSRQADDGSFYTVLGDTIIGAVAVDAAGAIGATVNLGPLCAKYKFTVTYSTTKMVVAPTVDLIINKQFGYEK